MSEVINKNIIAALVRSYRVNNWYKSIYSTSHNINNSFNSTAKVNPPTFCMAANEMNNEIN